MRYSAKYVGTVQGDPVGKVALLENLRMESEILS
jgi:hypothetical protein